MAYFKYFILLLFLFLLGCKNKTEMRDFYPLQADSQIKQLEFATTKIQGCGFFIVKKTEENSVVPEIEWPENLVVEFELLHLDNKLIDRIIISKDSLKKREKSDSNFIALKKDEFPIISQKIDSNFREKLQDKSSYFQYVPANYFAGDLIEDLSWKEYNFDFDPENGYIFRIRILKNDDNLPIYFSTFEQFALRRKEGLLWGFIYL